MKLTVPGRPGRSGRAALMYLLIVGIVAGVAVALTSFQVQLGITRPTPGGTAVVHALVEVEAALADGASYDEYAQTLRVAQVALRNYTVRNAADLELEPLVAAAVDRFIAVREAWHADLEDTWDETYADPLLWEGLHTGLEVPDGELGPRDVIDAATQQGAALLDDALALVPSD